MDNLFILSFIDTNGNHEPVSFQLRGKDIDSSVENFLMKNNNKDLGSFLVLFFTQSNRYYKAWGSYFLYNFEVLAQQYWSQKVNRKG